MTSTAFKDLSRATNMLRQHLLPRNFSGTGDYSDRTFTRVVSYRVLCHAAIEDYFETRVIEISSRASAEAKKGRITESAACLLSFAETHFGPPPDSLVAPQPNKKKEWPERVDIRERAARTASAHVAYASRHNHGIREPNILRLLLPIGFKISALDPILISELDNFGKMRGLFAHKSAAIHIKQKPNPEDEFKRIKKIISLMTDVDKEFDRILQSLK